MCEKRIENDLRNLLDCPSIEREESSVEHDLLILSISISVIVSKPGKNRSKGCGAGTDDPSEAILFWQEHRDFFKAIIVGYAVSLSAAGVP